MTYASGTTAPAEAVLFEALGDATRRHVFERVVQRPRSVGELAEGLPVSRPAVSQHLRVLEAAGLVTVEQDGRRRIVRPAPNGLLALRGWIEKYWTGVLDAFAAAAAELTESDHGND